MPQSINPLQHRFITWCIWEFITAYLYGELWLSLTLTRHSKYRLAMAILQHLITDRPQWKQCSLGWVPVSSMVMFTGSFLIVDVHVSSCKQLEFCDLSIVFKCFLMEFWTNSLIKNIGWIDKWQYLSNLCWTFLISMQFSKRLGTQYYCL